jgi:hypothetical protein
VNTGTARIVIIVALLVTGGLVLANAFSGAGVAAIGGPLGGGTSPTPSSSPRLYTGTPTPTPPPTPDPQAPKDVAVAVFNGTGTATGLAGVVMENLHADGYKVGQVPANAPNTPVDKTVVYYVGGPDAEQNKSDATELAQKYYPDAKVKELDPSYAQGNLVEKGVQVVVVIGVNDEPPA